MSLTEDEVIQILQFMAESSFNELHLEMGDLKIVVNKRPGPVPDAPREAASTDQAGSLTAHSLSADATTRDAAGEQSLALTSVTARDAHEGQQSSGEASVEAGLMPIHAPMLGIFYTAPKPGAPPFVEVGAVVDADTTVCIIEVMKLFTTIKATRPGRITRICAEDGQLVEYKQVLFWVHPHATGQGA